MEAPEIVIPELRTRAGATPCGCMIQVVDRFFQMAEQRPEMGEVERAQIVECGVVPEELQADSAVGIVFKDEGTGVAALPDR